MTAIIILVTCAILLSVVLVLLFGIYGVVISAVISGLTGASLLYLLAGFGNPTGYSVKPDLSELLVYFLLWFIAGLFIFFGLHVVKLLFIKQPVPKILTTIWIAGLMLSLISYVIYRIDENFTRKEIYVTFGYDDSLTLDYSNVKVSLANGMRENIITFNGKRSSKEKNRYGFRRSLSGNTVIHFKPSGLSVSVLKHSISVPLDKAFSDIVVYINEQNDLSIYLDAEIYIEVPGGGW